MPLAELISLPSPLRAIFRESGIALLGLLAGAAVAAAVMGADLPAMTGRLPGFYNDDAVNGIYLHDQLHDAVRAGRWSLADPNQFFPVGYAPKWTNGGNHLEMLVSGVLRMFLPWPQWMAGAYLIWFPLNTLAFAALGRRLWGRWLPAIAAGAAWSALPSTIEQMAAGWLTQVALVGVPLAVAGLLGIAEDGRRRDVVLAGVGMALTAYGYWFNALFLALLAPVLVLHGARRRSLGRLAIDLGLAAVLSLLLVAPGVLSVFGATLTGGWMPPAPMGPSRTNPIFPDALQIMGNQTRGTRYWLSGVLLPGMVITLALGRRRLTWLAAGGLCLLFALGPAQEISGQTWLLPYYPLWKHVPGLSRMSHPERWLLVGGLFLVILAADGLARRLHGVLVVLLPVGVIAQLWWAGNLPMGTWKLQLPHHWQLVADQPDGGAIIVVPLLRSGKTCAFQLFHGRPLLGGMLENQPWAFPPEYRSYLAASPLLVALRRISQGTDTEIPADSEDLARLVADGFDTLVLDGPSWRGVREARNIDIDARLRAALGAPWFSDERSGVWSLTGEGGTSHRRGGNRLR